METVVVGLPRGGVPVAYVVADALSAPLDVILVQKLGVAFQPELAMGAIGVSPGHETLTGDQAGLEPIDEDWRHGPD